jgi:predicted acetyltransferase
MPIEIRAATPDELPALYRADEIGFGGEPHDPDKSYSWGEAELDRTRVAFEAGRIVGVSRNYSFELTMPGGALVPAGAVSWVAVVPTHRRRGVLTQMIEALHADSRDRGEPVAILTASESVIYGRFGYGIATWRLSLEAQRSRIRFRDDIPGDTGRMRMVERAEADVVLPEVYDRCRRSRAAMVSRPPFWWPSVFWDNFGGKKKAFFVAVHQNERGVDDGFIAWESGGDWKGGIPDGDVAVWDMQADTGATRAALWRFCFDLDLAENMRMRGPAPIDDPLRHIVTDPRRVRVGYLNDGLWLAPLDPAELLGARTYAVPGRLVIEVNAPDDSRTTLAVESDASGTHCKTTTESPDLACDWTALGMALLGGNRWSELVMARRVRADRGEVVELADAMFLTSPAAAMLSAF